jgi:V8-like Glu-specific endopeptidase
LIAGRRLVLAAATVAALVALALPSIAAARDSVPHHGPDVAVERLHQGTHSALEYWTRARMRNAIPLMVEPPAAPAATASASSAEPGGEPIVIPPAAPEGWEPGTTTAVGSGLGKRPGGGGEAQGPIPYSSVELTDTTSYPTRTHGITFFKLGKFDYTCSGTAVNSASGSVVMTAGHCIHEGGKGRSWAKNVTFAPGYQDKVAPFGVWPARSLFTTKGWRKRARFSGDIGAAAMHPNPAGQTVEAAVGARGIAFNQPREQTYRSYGYPVGPAPKFDGESLWVCDSTFGYTDPFPEPKGLPQSAIGCDMQGGSSGGGWIVNDATLNSTTSFGYSFLPDVSFGPYYGDLAAQVYGRAAAG